MALSVEEREEFLAEPHIGALSVVEKSDRAPLTVPIWYQYSPGGELWVLTRLSEDSCDRGRGPLQSDGAAHRANGPVRLG